MLIFGAHMSIANGFTNAMKETHKVLHANAMQIFLKSPRGRAKSKLTNEEATEFKAYAREIDFKYTVIHCSYLLNFAKEGASWALKSLIDDMNGAVMLGASGVVLHVGKHLDNSYEDAFKKLIPNLKTVLAETSGANLILENTAGQGTEMGRSFEELAEIMDAVSDKRVKVCLDTCHSWAWGYDWNESEKVFKDFDRIIGLKNLDLIHFNDATREKGARIDRHANLGEGEIGAKNLREIVKFAEAKSIPLILETPERGGRTHSDDVRWLLN